MDSERTHLQRMTKLLSDNLHVYEQQAAAFGELHVPPFLKRQIEETREELKRIKENLAKLDASQSEQETISLAPGEIVARFEPLLKDLLQGNIGIERIWPNRRAWQTDPTDGLRIWQQRACKSKNVSILSNTLWNNWMHQEEEFRNGLFSNIASGAHVRILIYDPESDILAHRSILERDVPGEMQQEIKATLVRLAQGRNDLPISARKNLEVSLTTRTLHPVQMIRTGERMLVATYLVGKSGGPSPTMQLNGSDSAYFQKYAEQFKTLWGWAKPLTEDEQFDEIQRKYGSLPSPPAEW
jgi:hypothetical protein